MKDSEKELWELFEKTGNINCYLLLKSIDREDEKSKNK